MNNLLFEYNAIIIEYGAESMKIIRTQY